MENVQSNDFAMEYRLRGMNPDLHKRFTNAVFALQHILSNYKLIFPEYTDHTELHSLTVIDFCNRLMGDQINRMNADEIYVLLMGCYFHDTGMGISRKDYEEFSPQIDFGDYFETHDKDDIPAIIRNFHNEYAGCFIRKYADFFEIPSDEHLRAIVQIARGHRKTKLTDVNEYPTEMSVPGGSMICLPYLAALIRLADEIDVTAARNPIGMYDLDSFTDAHQVFEHKKHNAIRDLSVTRDEFVMMADAAAEEEIIDALRQMQVKMQKTLDQCREAVIGRTPYVITQSMVRLQILTVPAALRP